MHTDRLLTASLALALATTASAQTHVYVDDDALPGGDGLSWQTAFNDLHDAIDLAKTLGQNRGEIRIAGGTYKPDRGTGDINMAFRLPLPEAGEPIFDLTGGYAGLANPATPDDRNPAIYPTTISADLLGNDMDSTSTRSDNAARLLVIDDTAAAAAPVSAVILNGIGFRGATVSAFSNQGSGFAAYIQSCQFFDNIGDSGCVARLVNASVTLYGCSIENNATYLRDGIDGCILLESSEARFEFCNIVSNMSHYGSGGAIVSTNSSVAIWISALSYNIAAQYGGAIYCVDSQLDSTGTVYESNRAGDGGGALFATNSQVDISDTFRENSAGRHGGAIYAVLGSIEVSGVYEYNSVDVFDGGAIYVADHPEPYRVDIEYCNFVGNTAERLGGAIVSLSPLTRIYTCDFAGNTAGSEGGGAYAGGYVTRCDFVSNAAHRGGGLSIAEGTRVRDCEFVKNTANQGGAISGDYDGVLIEDSSFTENSATGNGGAISSAEIVTTSIFTGNTAKDSGGAMYGVDRIERSSVLSNHAARGGALHNPREIQSSLIRNNTAAYGGAIYSNRNRDLSISDSVFLDNNAWQLGTHIHTSSGGALDIIRSTLASNNTESLPMLNIWGGFVWIESSIIWDKASNPAPTIQLSQGTSAVLFHSCTRLGSGDIQTVSPSDLVMLGLNIGSDPMFTSISTGNLSLRPTSPCIDSGLQAVGSNLPSTDVYGAPRGPKDDPGLSNRGLGLTEYLDIGAVEFQGTSCFADTNFDGVLTPADFSAWVAAYNRGDFIADQNRDGFLTPSDFSAWVANYNAGCP